MTAGTDFQKHYRLKAKLEKAIEDAKALVTQQEMPNEVWKDEDRRLDWITQDRSQWNYNNSRLARLQRLYDQCFPKMEWVNGQIEAFFRAEEGPLY